MPERVVNQIEHQSLQKRRRATHAHTRAGVPGEGPALLLGHRLQRLRHLAHQIIELDRLVARRHARRSGFHRAQGEEVLRESSETFGLLQRVEEPLAIRLR